MITESAKIKFNEKAKINNKEISVQQIKEPLGIYQISTFKNPFYCRFVGCTKLTNTVLIVDLNKFEEEVLHIKGSGGRMFVPVCSDHEQQEKAGIATLSSAIDFKHNMYKPF